MLLIKFFESFLYTFKFITISSRYSTTVQRIFNFQLPIILYYHKLAYLYLSIGLLHLFVIEYGSRVDINSLPFLLELVCIKFKHLLKNNRNPRFPRQLLMPNIGNKHNKQRIGIDAPIVSLIQNIDGQLILQNNGNGLQSWYLL